MKFRTKPTDDTTPIIVDAIQLLGATFDATSGTFTGSAYSEKPQWLTDALARGDVTPKPVEGFTFAQFDVKTVGGTVTAEPGDWLLHNDLGQLSVFSSASFASGFGPVGQPLEEPVSASPTDWKCPRCLASFSGGKPQACPQHEPGCQEQLAEG